MATMEIERRDFNKLRNMISYKLRSSNVELECRYMQPLSKEAFGRAVQYYCSTVSETSKSQKHFKEDVIKEHDETLDIITKRGRITLTGRQVIQKYCSTNTLGVNDVKEAIEKMPIKGFYPIYLNSINFKVDLKDEKPITDKEALIKDLAQTPKLFRFKKRISVSDPKNGIRYDMTIVKSSNEQYLSFIESGVMNVPERYEFEIELISTLEDAKALIKTMAESCMVITGNTFVDRIKVVNNYLQLTNQKVEKPHYVFSRPRRYLVGPKPVTLEMKNITTPPVLGVTNISDTVYTVTEKTDGERHIMFIDDVGEVYLINNRFDIIPLGLKIPAYKHSIFDGEWVEGSRLYALFDAYYVKNTDVRGLPLVGAKGRLHHIELFHKNEKVAFANVNILLHNKEFLVASDKETIYDQAAKVLLKDNRGEFPYHTDGLIFTPANYPVGALYENGDPYSFGTWVSVLKWKPSHENSIDFLVKYARDEKGQPKVLVKDGIIYNVCDLYVGYKPTQWEKIKAIDYLSSKLNTQEDEKYSTRKFLPPDYVGNDISIYLAESSLGLDDKIAEFSYNTKDNKWEYMRIRTDKTIQYHNNGITDTANDWNTALSIWRGINSPVQVDMITGAKKVDPSTVPDESIYYQRNTSRDKFASRPMMIFHNEIKNNVLIANEENKRLLDLACGKGGDLNKWLSANIKEVVGFDYVADNIENPIDGVYSRMISNKRDSKLTADHKYVFLPMDCSKVLEPQGTYTEEDKQVANVLWGISNDPQLNKYKGMMKTPFDVVSCQFALHYFFANETSFDTFLDNVDAFLSEGGHFIGTCLDGHKVKNALGKNKSLVGKKGSRTIWEITKKYSASKSKKIAFGEAIDVYMESIGRITQEYLVDFNILEAELEKRGYKKVFIKSFEQLYDEMLENSQDDTKNHIKGMQEDEKLYSFLNVAFCFEKGKQTKPVTKAVAKKPRKTEPKIVQVEKQEKAMTEKVPEVEDTNLKKKVVIKSKKSTKVVEDQQEVTEAKVKDVKIPEVKVSKSKVPEVKSINIPDTEPVPKKRISISKKSKKGDDTKEEVIIVKKS